MISGADGWTSIALYGQKKLELLRRFLPFENGTPSHDQLGILFSRLDMEEFQSCFISWVASLNETLEGVVAVDGKTLRRSFASSSSQAAIHMVSAWACGQKLVLGQRKVDDKSNEITAIPELLNVNLLSKVTLICRPIMPPLRDGRTVREEPQPDQLAGRTIPILSMQIIPGCLSIAAR